MLRALLSTLLFSFTVLIVWPSFAADEVCVDQVTSENYEFTESLAQCNADYQCPGGQICQYGQCRMPECWSDTSCAPWEICRWGRCERDPWSQRCWSDADCRIGYRCWAGYCKRW